MSSKYADIFGKPNTGVHSIRILGFAFVDIVLTLIVAGITTYASGLPFILSFADWFFLGETLHYFLGVKTRFIKLISV